MIDLTTGNLFEAQAEALVNAVNTEGVMGKGIALQFKRKFPAMFENYQAACKAGRVTIGQMHVYEREHILSPRFIINFPTKQEWRLPSQLDDIRAGLSALASMIRERKIRSIAVPALGCGNGGLDWSEVLPAIQDALNNLQDIHIMVYAPAGESAANQIAQT